MKKLFLSIAVLFLIVLNSGMAVRVYAQSADDLQKTIADLQNKIAGLQSQKDSLSKQIGLLDSQITLTTLEIDDTKRKIAALDTEIQELDSQILTLEDQKTRRLEMLIHRIPLSYKRAVAPQFGWLLFSSNFTELLTRAKYLSQIQEGDALLYKQLQLTQNDFNTRKDAREKKKDEQEALKAQLDQKTAQLAVQKSEKQTLLSQTQNDEKKYQALLSAAKAQLASFASFATSQGGGLLSGQTHCDDWGCYYNQRDSEWGNVLINNSNDCGGPCSIARVGCLITSVAMVANHNGVTDIRPVDIAVSDPNNFSVGTAMLRYTISVKGRTIARSDVSLTPENVSKGPLIVGVRYGPFGTHFVVIKDFKDGKYIMNDPYQANGHDMVFTDSYSIGSVFEVNRVSI